MKPRDGVPTRPLTAKAKQMISDVCQEYRLSERELLSVRRTKRIATARHELYLRLYEESHSGNNQHRPYSLPHIGAMLGKHHTTILSGIRRAKKLRLDKSKELDAMLRTSRLADTKIDEVIDVAA